MTPSAYCIIVAAGSGTRFGSPLPKQFCDLGGRPVVMHAIERFRRVLPYAEILLVISTDFRERWLNLCQSAGIVSPTIVSGGETRWQSVRNALDKIPDKWDGPVLIHDGARPLVSRAVIDNSLKAIANGAHGVVPCVHVVDSIRAVGSDGTTRITDRSKLLRVQTPQTFPAHIIKNAYARAYSPIMTDDASVCEMAGYGDIAIVDGDERTLKITHPADLAMVSFYLNQCSENGSFESL